MGKVGDMLWGDVRILETSAPLNCPVLLFTLIIILTVALNGALITLNLFLTLAFVMLYLMDTCKMPCQVAAAAQGQG